MAKSRFDTDDSGRRLRTVLGDQRLLGGTAEVIEDVAARGKVETIGKGESFIVQDEDTDDVFLILAGTCEVLVNGRRMSTRGAGQHVGEMAAIEPSQPRSATVKALETMQVLRLSGNDFAELGAKYPALYLSIARTLAQRLRERNRHVGKHHNISKVLLISSAEGLPIAQTFQELFEHDKEIVVDIWKDGVFRLSDYALESLERALEECDFGVAIATADDVVRSRKKRWPAPRDNVIFELGLFMGRLGRERAILMEQRDEGVKLPTDTLGMTTLTYKFDEKRAVASLGPAYSKLKRHILEKGPFNG
ncbi:TIR domain-containing protein [Mesorhizobium sp.]|uniref:TIR domain-containing protein n=1 Tax=Mesorhizobium sp. TaxID=1871066 RepID=UPI000FE952C6|nr:TIR domain-containing protein [Mesorhizobium sp.]RWG07848.1 MAG: cyclic nucleotide-binding domain-containing protein [Mesorhizobium sp.]TIN47494.1 MAG: cyclic nucleotide-binding domain-containing protein [Mesorhizobium sp.]